MNIFTPEIMNSLFELLENTQGVIQKPEHHPEGDTFQHSLQVLTHAFRESYDIDLILAAMLHDIGKQENTLGHDKIGAEWLDGIVGPKTIWLIRNHIRIIDYLSGNMHKLSKCKELANHPWLPELIQLRRWDNKGRNPNKKMVYNKEMIMVRLNNCVDKHFTEGI